MLVRLSQSDPISGFKFPASRSCSINLASLMVVFLRGGEAQTRVTGCRWVQVSGDGRNLEKWPVSSSWSRTMRSSKLVELSDCSTRMYRPTLSVRSRASATTSFELRRFSRKLDQYGMMFRVSRAALDSPASQCMSATKARQGAAKGEQKNKSRN